MESKQTDIQTLCEKVLTNDNKAIEILTNFMYSKEEREYIYNFFKDKRESIAVNFCGLYFYEKQDYKKAVEYFQKAADLNCGYGYMNLGNCYYSGNGVEQDHNKAVEYYLKAEKLGIEIPDKIDRKLIDAVKQILELEKRLKENDDTMMQFIAVGKVQVNALVATYI